MSARTPHSGGITAPPTMAVAITPEPSAERLPSPSLARLKIVGNMMELTRPTAISAQPAASRLALAENRINPIASAPTVASSLPGDAVRRMAEPIKPPSSAPPQ